jgi:hypothetical protein
VTADRGRIDPAIVSWKRLARDLLIVAAGVLSLLLIVSTPLFTGEDWNAITHGSQLVVAGQSPYEEPLYRWSPLAAWLMVPVVALPYSSWVVLHVAGLLALADPILIGIGLIAWPFWQDAGLGNVLTFVVLVAYWALRGNRFAIGAFFVMCVLMPRPLMLPVLAWLLWRRSETRLPFAVLALASTAGALLTGYGVEWLQVLAQRSASDIANPYQIGPSLLIGVVWLPIGLAIAALLTWKGRLGLASIAASPYWLPYYLLMLLLDVPGMRPSYRWLEVRDHPSAALSGMSSATRRSARATE